MKILNKNLNFEGSFSVSFSEKFKEIKINKNLIFDVIKST